MNRFKIKINNEEEYKKLIKIIEIYKFKNSIKSVFFGRKKRISNIKMFLIENKEIRMINKFEYKDIKTFSCNEFESFKKNNFLIKEL